MNFQSQHVEVDVPMWDLGDRVKKRGDVGCAHRSPGFSLLLIHDDTDKRIIQGY